MTAKQAKKAKADNSRAARLEEVTQNIFEYFQHRSGEAKALALLLFEITMANNELGNKLVNYLYGTLQSGTDDEAALSYLEGVVDGIKIGAEGA